MEFFRELCFKLQNIDLFICYRPTVCCLLRYWWHFTHTLKLCWQCEADNDWLSRWQRKHLQSQWARPQQVLQMLMLPEKLLYLQVDISWTPSINTVAKTNTQSRTQPFNGSSVATGRHMPSQPQSGRVMEIAEIQGENGGGVGVPDHLGQTSWWIIRSKLWTRPTVSVCFCAHRRTRLRSP